jgi:hypothetical protein
MTDKEVNTVLDEIAPKDERGKYKMGTFLNVICLPDNDCSGVSEDYERLAITKIGSTNVSVRANTPLTDLIRSGFAAFTTIDGMPTVPASLRIGLGAKWKNSEGAVKSRYLMG